MQRVQEQSILSKTLKYVPSLPLVQHKIETQVPVHIPQLSLPPPLNPVPQPEQQSSPSNLEQLEQEFKKLYTASYTTNPPVQKRIQAISPIERFKKLRQRLDKK